ncbi:MAG: hypothetical protein AYL32_014250 [Candidatus Bathyarchaeota archaeon B26-2]|nr:MAG: hypothetical protein AYL32_014250 [Candidatus Bathyarchaeota archaeon B26-2]
MAKRRLDLAKVLIVLEVQTSFTVAGLSFFPVEFEGSPWDIGFKRGRLFRDILASIREMYLPQYVGEKMLEHKRLTERTVKDMENLFPELVEELKGVAAGSGLDEEDIFMINAWWENPVWPSRFPPNTGCSAVAFTESSLGPIMGQTLDIGRNPYWVMVHVKPRGGYSFFGTLRADMLGGARCINEKGLSMGGGTVSVKDRGDGLPRPVVFRALMERCATVDEAIEFLREMKVSVKVGTNLLLLDASGNAAVVEKSPTKMAVRWQEDDGICATNHFLTEEMKHLNAGSAEMIERYSQPRIERLKLFLREGDREKPITALKRVLRSHGLGGLCYHGDEWPWPTTTQLANILLSREREMYVSLPMGPPCMGHFIRYRPFSP